MSISPILLLHICSGTLGVLSGAAAMLFRKGSSRHRLTGNVFVVSMLALAATGVYMAMVKSQPGNIMGGSLTFYLVATAWMIIRRNGQKMLLFDLCALLFALALGTICISFALQAAGSPVGLKYGYPPGPYVFLGSVALLAAAGDIRMLLRGGLSATQRLARHLWRMCFALFIASASIFLARQHLFPAIFRKTGTLYLLSFLPLLIMLFWLARLSFSRHPRWSSIFRTGKTKQTVAGLTGA